MMPKICNICGKTFDVWDEQEDFSIHRNVGFGSKYDLSKISLDMCCSCFDNVMDYIVSQCKITPIVECEL